MTRCSNVRKYIAVTASPRRVRNTVIGCLGSPHTKTALMLGNKNDILCAKS